MGCARARVQLDAITFGATASTCEKGGVWEKAVQLVSVELDTAVQYTAISACETGRQWKKAMQLIVVMVQSQVKLDPILVVPQPVPVRREASGRSHCCFSV